MGYFPVRYDYRVVIYDPKMLIRLATDSITSVSGYPLFIILTRYT